MKYLISCLLLLVMVPGVSVAQDTSSVSFGRFQKTRIIDCPAPKVFIADYWNCWRSFNFIYKDLIVSSSGVCRALDHQILSFDVIYKNEDSVWYQASNIGGQFTEQDKKVFFDKFTIKDTLYIDNIITIGNDSALRYPEKGRYFLR